MTELELLGALCAHTLPQSTGDHELDEIVRKAADQTTGRMFDKQMEIWQRLGRFRMDMTATVDSGQEDA